MLVCLAAHWRVFIRLKLQIKNVLLPSLHRPTCCSSCLQMEVISNELHMTVRPVPPHLILIPQISFQGKELDRCRRASYCNAFLLFREVQETKGSQW